MEIVLSYGDQSRLNNIRRCCCGWWSTDITTGEAGALTGEGTW